MPWLHLYTLLKQVSFQSVNFHANIINGIMLVMLDISQNAN